MRIMALDVGERRIGVAVSDALLMTAQGIEVIHRTSPAKDWERLRQLYNEYDVQTIVLGLPKNMNGTLGPRSEWVQEFSRQLQEVIPQATIHFWDERLSTVAAERTLLEADLSRSKRRQVIDKMAAVFILQGYLNSLPHPV
ncbi:MAG TPA: Holliday junction resolvase RuvX [Patescibacteria group bacterium]|nr:Holliday junction resolvase RuvX [Patescibacteria group bacterium]